ncbi:MAG: tRNA (adenosine(37)-N6)-threonylcarbamoyltransferase complex dimerization subunit type 1 TsaB [bacterium]|nr:tRNA (adenosine(37)-N6)-threonylcarbamoyltransferase complex dimerization subunit type 1 TsaB [bacterium]
MVLFIDTTDFESVRIALVQEENILEKSWQVEKRVSETLLKKIKELFKRKKVKFQDLKKIVTVKGPGSFSRTRTGVVAANALGFALDIPIVGLKKDEIPQNLVKLLHLKGEKTSVKPFYSKPANITKPKKK